MFARVHDGEVIYTHTNRDTKPRRNVNLSAHALSRWTERAQVVRNPARARIELGEFVARGRRRPTPRRWTTVHPYPGLTFIYWAERSDLVALVKDRTVVTVLSRSVCRGRVYDFEELIEVPCALPARWQAPLVARVA